MESSHNIKSHLWLQERGEFPATEATLYEKRLEMTLRWELELLIRHPLGSLGQTQGLGLPLAGPLGGGATVSVRVAPGP